MTYTTIQGDMWDGIAFFQLGDAALAGKLMEANPQYCQYFIFPAGIVLTLPEQTAATPETAPPWKREAG